VRFWCLARFGVILGMFASMTAWAETPAEQLMALVGSQDLDKISAYLAQPGVGINDRPGNVKTLLDFAAEKISSRSRSIW
jgi:hypothetical protein